MGNPYTGLFQKRSDTAQPQQPPNPYAGMFSKVELSGADVRVNTRIAQDVNRHIQDPTYVYNATTADDNFFFNLAENLEDGALKNVLSGVGADEAIVRFAYNEPITFGRALIGGTLDMLKLPVNLVIPGTAHDFDYSQGQSEAEVIKNALSMGATIAGGAVGAVAGIPLGASAVTGLAGASLGAAFAENKLRDTPFLQALTTDAGLTALTLGLGAMVKGGAGAARYQIQKAALQKIVTARTAAAGGAKVTIYDLVSQGDPEIGRFSSAVLGRAIEAEGKVFKTIQDIDTRGYLIRTAHDGTFTIVEETQTAGKRLAQHPVATFSSVEEVEAHLKTLPRRDGWQSGVDGLYAPYHDIIKPGFIARQLQRLNDAVSSKGFGVYLSNLFDRAEAIERTVAGLVKNDRRIFMNFDGEPPSIMANMIIPLERSVSAFHNSYKKVLHGYKGLSEDLRSVLKPFHWREYPAIRQRIGTLASHFITDERLKFLNPLEKQYADQLTHLVQSWNINPNLGRIYKYFELEHDGILADMKKYGIDDPTAFPKRYEEIVNANRAEAAAKSGITDPERRVATLLDEVNKAGREQIDVTRVLDVYQRQIHNVRDAADYITRNNMSGPLVAMARRFTNELRDSGWGSYGTLDNFYAGQVYVRFGAVVGSPVIDPTLTANRNIRRMITSDQVALLDHTFDPERNLLKLTEASLWSEHVGNRWYDTRTELDEIIRKAGLSKQGTAVAQLFESLNVMRGRHFDDGLDRAALLDAYAGTAADKSWKNFANPVLDGLSILMSTGLLGYRPKLGFRDVIDATSIYGVYLHNPIESMKVLGREYASVAKHGAGNPTRAFERWLEATADDDLSAAKLLEAGHISRYENFEYLKKLARDARSPLGRKISEMMEKYAEFGEKSSLQPQVFVINQAAVWRNEYKNALHALREWKGQTLTQEDRLKVLARTKALFQSDETIRELDKLLATGRFDDYAKGLADAVNLSLLGRFGLGFGPPTGGRFTRLLFNFRTFAATRKQSIAKMITRGSRKDRILSSIMLAGNEALWANVGPILGLRPLYMSQIAGIGYTGGPLFDMAAQFVDDYQLMDEYTPIEEPLANAWADFWRMMWPEKAVRDATDVISAF